MGSPLRGSWTGCSLSVGALPLAWGLLSLWTLGPSMGPLVVLPLTHARCPLCFLWSLSEEERVAPRSLFVAFVDGFFFIL